MRFFSNLVYKRNLYTEQDLGIKLDWYQLPGSIYTQTRNFINKLEARISDNTDPVDLIAAQARSMPYLMVEGKLNELNTYSDSLDLSKTWWPENVKEACEVKGRLYFLSGDISANLLRMMTVIFVNKTTLESRNYNYEELMQKVLDYEWTIDDLIEMTTGMYEDVDQDSDTSRVDKYGLVSIYFHTDGLYAGLGYKYMTMSSKDGVVLRISSQLGGELAANYVKKMKDWHDSKDFSFYFPEQTCADIFKDGNSMFALHRAWFGFEIQKTELKTGVLPTPALDVDQGRYYTTIGHQFTLYGISKDSPDYDRAAQTLQVLGYHAFKETTPALFDVSFQGQHSKDDYAIQMYNIIRDSVVLDAGRIYDVLVSTLEDGFRNNLVSHIVSYSIRGFNTEAEPVTYNFNSMSDPIRKKVEKQIEAANEKILNFLESEEG